MRIPSLALNELHKALKKRAHGGTHSFQLSKPAKGSRARPRIRIQDKDGREIGQAIIRPDGDGNYITSIEIKAGGQTHTTKLSAWDAKTAAAWIMEKVK